jgi:putative transposase
MKDFIRNFIESPQLTVGNVGNVWSVWSVWPEESSLGEIIREGAEKVVKMAVMAEFENFFSQYSHLKEENGKQLIVRNGFHRERNVMTPAGNIRVKIPRLVDRREEKSQSRESGSKDGERLNFHSKLIPPYLRRADSVNDFIPYLYLKGISTGDFSDVLSQLLGEKVSLSAQTVSRLKKQWENEYSEWSQRNLSGKHYVYWWADGVYFDIRMESERNCMLVIVGALSDGRKELVAVREGPRESELSWQNLLLDLKRHGLSLGPLMATGDGSLGFWNALTKEYPETRHQRCWVHKTVNILDKLPKSLQPEATSMIHEIYMSPTRNAALKAFDDFVRLFKVKYPKATDCLVKDKEQLLTFYDFPAEHWRHIRSTNVIESTFATVRLRTYRTKGCLSRQTALTMVFKLIQAAEKKWQRIQGYELLPIILSGEEFIDGELKVA